MSDDSSLLRSYLQNGSDSAFAELVRRHLPAVYRTALRTLAGDTHAAADIAQQTFAELARSAAILAAKPSLVGWLYTVAHRLAVNRIRSDHRRRQRERLAAGMESSDASNEPDPRSFAAVLDVAMSELGAMERELILLRFFHAQSYQEIGRALRVGEGAVRKRTERSLAKLRSALACHGITSVGSALTAALAAEGAATLPAGLPAAILAGVAPLGIGTVSTAALAGVPFALMTTTTKVLVASAVALAMGGMLGSYHFYREATEARRNLTDIHARLQTALEARDSATVSSPPAAKIEGAADPVHVSDRSTQSETAAASSPDNEGRRIEKLLLRNPELQRLYTKQRTLRIRETYGPLYRTLKFSAAQVARFESIMSDFVQGDMDVRIAGLTMGAGKGDVAVAKLLNQVTQERDRAIQALGGDAAVAEFYDFERTAAWRSGPAQLASALYYTEEPLTGEQGERLVDLFAARAQALGNRNTLAGAEGEATVMAASAFLSPLQLEAMRAWKEKIDTGQAVWAIVNPANEEPPGHR